MEDMLLLHGLFLYCSTLSTKEPEKPGDFVLNVYFDCEKNREI